MFSFIWYMFANKPSFIKHVCVSVKKIENLSLAIFKIIHVCSKFGQSNNRKKFKLPKSIKGFPHACDMIWNWMVEYTYTKYQKTISNNKKSNQFYYPKNAKIYAQEFLETKNTQFSIVFINGKKVWILNENGKGFLSHFIYTYKIIIIIVVC